MTLCCALCEHYIGGGDFNLCCRKKYDLCYADTPACEQFKMDYRARDIYRAGARAQKKYMETRQPKNNYELLQSMSIDELAKWLDLLVNRAAIYGENKVWMQDSPRYYADWLEWLRQEIAQCDGG